MEGARSDQRNLARVNDGVICYEKNLLDSSLNITLGSVNIEAAQLEKRILKLRSSEINVIIVIDNEDGAFNRCFSELK